MRDADKARAAFGDSVDIVAGDLRDASSVSVALKGVERVFLNSPSLDGFIDLQRPLIDAANAAGVGHLVRLSVAGAAPDATTSCGRGHFALDEHLKASTLSWTILQPIGFMQNLLSNVESIKTGAIYASSSNWGRFDVGVSVMLLIPGGTLPGVSPGANQSSTPAAWSSRDLVGASTVTD